MTAEESTDGPQNNFEFHLIRQVAIALGFSFINTSLSVKKNRRNWRGLASCLRIGTQKNRNVSSDEVLRFIHRNQYMIVPTSNPPTPQQTRPAFRPANRSTRDMSSSGADTTRSLKCPFTFQVKDFINTVPRFLSFASCPGCPGNCEPVMYTHRILLRNCKNFWLWTEKTLPTAFVWVQDHDWSPWYHSTVLSKEERIQFAFICKCWMILSGTLYLLSSKSCYYFFPNQTRVSSLDICRMVWLTVDHEGQNPLTDVR